MVTNNRRIAVLISHSYGEPFESLKERIQPLAWESLVGSDIDVYFSIGKRSNKMSKLLDRKSTQWRYSERLWILQRAMDRITLCIYNIKLPKVVALGNILQTDIPEGVRFQGAKTLASFRYLYENNYDVVYRTTMSTIPVASNFLYFARTIELDTPYYGGVVNTYASTSFVSGAGVFLNRSSLKLLVQNIHNWRHSDLDDIAISRILKKFVEPTGLSAINVYDHESARDIDVRLFETAIHVRCKSSQIPRDDSGIMKVVLEKYQKYLFQPFNQSIPERNPKSWS